jgi:hypothetical protein
MPVTGWREERVGTSDDEKKFLMGMVTADRNTEDLAHAAGPTNILSPFKIFANFAPRPRHCSLLSTERQFTSHLEQGLEICPGYVSKCSKFLPEWPEKRDKIPIGEVR